MNLTEAKKIAATLSYPSKMPGTGYSLPARACLTGSKLAVVPGTACFGCYALKDRWTWPNPQKAMQRRLEAIAHPQWVEAIVRLLTHTHRNGRIRVDLGNTGVRLQRVGGKRYRWNEAGYHRWHDSGDLQSVEHLRRICEVARRTPALRHWLPTQELEMVRDYLRAGDEIPPNLVIRVSSVLVDGKRRNWPLTSSVTSARGNAEGHQCPAPAQEHRCLDCRACWSADVAHVVYALH